MSFSRRDFIKSLGASAFLTACGSNNEGGQESNSGSSNQSGYVPNVTRAYFPSEYSLTEEVSNPGGWVYLDSGYPGEYDGYMFRPKRASLTSVTPSLPGIEAYLVEDGTDTSRRILIATDTQGSYMPAVRILDDISDGSNNTADNVDKAKSAPVFMFHKEFSGYDFFKEITEGVFGIDLGKTFPTYIPEHMPSSPLLTYHGDWSINNLINQAQLRLGAAEMVLGFVGSGGLNFSYGISTTQLAFDALRYALDWIDELNPDLIDEDKKYPIYTLGPSPKNIIISLVNQPRPSSENIKDLFPLQPGNVWNYGGSFNSGSVDVRGVENINGRNLLVVKSTSGLEEFFGYSGDELGYYGFKDPYSGDRIFFDPPFKWGDNSVSVGKEYFTSSDIISEREGIIGRAEDSMKCEARELIYPNNTPYGDCFKVIENASVNISGNRQTITGTHWFVRNIGQVRLDVEGRNLDLIDFKKDSRESNLNNLSSQNPSSGIPSLTQKILKLKHNQQDF